jgi:diguanylate cyclase (GGDEF)-like protein
MIRMVIVAGAVTYAFSDYALQHTGIENVRVGRIVAVLSAVVATLILVSSLRMPSPVPVRRLIGITHDTLAVSCAMYLGVDANATFGVISMVVIVGNGFRFGASYMLYAACCALLSFAAVYATSPGWQANGTLSFYIAAMLVVVPAYMYGLLSSLHRARAELELRASHDHLTGLMNRAGIEHRIMEVVGTQPRGHVLIYFDLDRFKQVNDNAGHAAGDRLLAEVARIVRHNVRPQDLCARLGGDEFCVLLVDCSIDEGSAIAERIRGEVHRFRLLWGGRAYSVGTSIGVASSDSVQDGPSLLRLADAACYAAKNAGRNSVHVVGPAVRASDTGLLRRLHLGE